MKRLAGWAITLFFQGFAQAAVVYGQGTWETTLQARDLDGNFSTIDAYYDTVQDITWLADASYATQNFSGDGMLWQEAVDWADSFSIGGYNNWRLPNTVDVGNDGYTYTSIYEGVDYGYNITTHSEISYMYYEILGNTAYYDTNGVEENCASTTVVLCLTNSGPFSNLPYSDVPQSFIYWSATDYAPDTSHAWIFLLSDGFQTSTNKDSAFNAWAVHDGDIGVALPAPAAAWLFFSAIGGFTAIRRITNR